MSHNKKLIVGFIGKIGSGKDTAADFLEDYWREKHQRASFRFAFADILKNIVHETFDIRTEEANSIKRFDSVRPFNGRTLREVYQNFGEAIKTYFGESVWVDITMRRVHEEMQALKSDLIICTDVRYPYELAAIKKFAEDNGFNYKFIKMVNLNQTQRTDNLSAADLHISEQIDGLEYTDEIRSKTVMETDSKIREIFKDYLKG